MSCLEITEEVLATITVDQEVNTPILITEQAMANIIASHQLVTVITTEEE